jgi:MFS transporter, DHA1 family, multidrug resistance protein
MGVGAILNSQLVRRWGMRRLSHGSILAFLGVSVVQAGAAVFYDGQPMAMEPLGAVAGTASSFMGFYTTLAAALLGLAIGQAFDGTVLPLGVGYVVLSVLAVLVVLWTEKGRLFVPQNEAGLRQA